MCVNSEKRNVLQKELSVKAAWGEAGKERNRKRRGRSAKEREEGRKRERETSEEKTERKPRKVEVERRTTVWGTTAVCEGVGLTPELQTVVSDALSARVTNPAHIDRSSSYWLSSSDVSIAPQLASCYRDCALKFATSQPAEVQPVRCTLTAATDLPEPDRLPGEGLSQSLVKWVSLVCNFFPRPFSLFHHVTPAPLLDYALGVTLFVGCLCGDSFSFWASECPDYFSIWVH